jgi:hypothetical protein
VHKGQITMIFSDIIGLSKCQFFDFLAIFRAFY